MSTPELRLVGYWHDPFDSDDWPDPSEHVDPNWEQADRSRIVSYLQCGVRVHEDLGFSHCRFEGGPPDHEMGNAELTDGIWIWPEGLSVYVERYSVKLPSEFVEHMRARDFKLPKGIDSAELENAPVDLDFWRRWCTHNQKLPNPDEGKR